MLLASLFIFSVICYQNVFGKRVLCDFDNTNCVTQGSRRIYQVFVNGEVEGVPQSNIMCADLIDVNLPTIEYTLRDSKISDLRNCYVEFASINTKHNNYNYNLACKNLTFEGRYELKGYVGSMYVEGKGDYKTKMYDYVFLLSGSIDQYDDKDGGIHFQMSKDFKLDIDARGKVVFSFKNLYNGDEVRASALHKFVNKNWKVVDRTVHKPLMEQFMSLYLDHANTFLKELAVEHYFYEEVLD